ncbi:MAG: metallophosphoesterase [Bacteroidetes bacterium]|nr:MAG: metallophosphoesterase [Bacteroidota bacterium]
MRNYTWLMPLFLAGLFLSSCANYKLNYAKSENGWKDKHPDPELEHSHRMYLVGDAGYLSESGKNPVLDHLKEEVSREGKASSVLFLGDNIYQSGMPEKTAGPEREQAEQRIGAQLDAVAEFPGEILFLAGNHDWRHGLEGVRRQERYVEDFLNGRYGIKDDDEKGWKNYFVPDAGCSGPEVIEINDDIVVLAIDSQWWLADWDKEPKINDGCEIKSRAHFKFEMENVLRKYRRKNVVVAMHHPPYTYGPHGGRNHIKEHFFPLTQLEPHLYIPMPGVGTLAAFLRAAVGSKQDVPNGVYKGLVDALLIGARKNGTYIFASGHEHTLQYIENDNQRFIVSGAGSKTSPVALGTGSKFAYGAPGYSTIDFYTNGEAWVHYWALNKSKSGMEEVYRTQIKAPAEDEEEAEKVDFSEYEQHLATVEKPVIQDKVEPKGNFYSFVMGRHYRDVYLGSYTFPVLDLSTHLGGLTPIKQGGGNQTNSLRLVDGNGREYVLRDLTKDVSRLLPFPLNKMTAARAIAVDNFLSTHPFAPLAIPTLADAAEVYHANPIICYVPKQPALGDYNAHFGGSVYLFEERAGGDWSGTGVFGNSEKIIGTPDLVTKTLKNNNHKIDQRWAVRSRLFDLLIGDWDRHDDQWRWARFKDGKRKFYRPVPRDRDQAFSKYDGVVTAIARQTMPFLRQLRAYSPTIPNMKWATWSSRHFDNGFLNMMTWPEWEREALYIQRNVTDSIIDAAFTTWPERAYALSAEPIKQTLRQRRDSLVEFARRRYLLLAEKVDVYGTDESELFEITRLNNSEVLVRIFELSKKGEPKDLVYERVFNRLETKVINIYGIGDDDVFEVSGEVEQSILIRLIGGQGMDTFIDNSRVIGNLKSTYVYDDREGNVVQGNGDTRDARTRKRIYNLYDHRASHFEYDYTVPLPLFAINPDDGLQLGINLTRTTYRFKKDPYHAQHNFVGSFAFATRSWYLQYNGDYLNTFGTWDFLLETQFSGPTYAFNYFGYGNDADADFENRDINYYRVRQGQLYIFPALKKRFAGNNGQFFIGPMLDARNLEDTEGRFITSPESGLAAKDFETQYFVGAQAGIKFNNLDNWLNPHRGVVFHSKLTYRNHLNRDEYNFYNWRTDLSMYVPLDRQEAVVFATRLGFNHNIRERFEFYHAPSLGGRGSLRGYRAERFYGKTSFYQNIDLRLRLFRTYNKVLPFTMGIFGGFDHGRVWEEEDLTDDVWQYDYGGGVWLSPLDGLMLYFGVFQPKENDEDGPRFFFRLGAGF